MHITFGHGRKHFHGVMDIPSFVPSCFVKVNHNGINSNDITQHTDVHKYWAIKWQRLQTVLSQMENSHVANVLFIKMFWKFKILSQSVQYKWVRRACLRVKSWEHFQLFDVTVTGFHWFYWFYLYYFALGCCCCCWQLLNAVASVIDWNSIL